MGRVDVLRSILATNQGAPMLKTQPANGSDIEKGRPKRASSGVSNPVLGRKDPDPIEVLTATVTAGNRLTRSD